MECNKDEAKRAMEIAERKLLENDYDGAKKFVNKAQNLYPKLDGLEQVSMMIHVYISASNKNNGGGEEDWYGILGVDPSADDETVKRRYKKLALLLHPDKNRFNGAEGAFKLVLDAWCLLSDKPKRIAYDQKRKSKEVQQKKKRRWKRTPRANSQAASGNSSTDAFSTTSESDSAKASQERIKRWHEESLRNLAAAFAATRNANEAERPFEKPNSTDEAQRLFKRPMKTGFYANSNLEAESPMTRGDPNSTFEAKRLFRSRWQM